MKQIWVERQSQSFVSTAWKTFILLCTLTPFGPVKFLLFEFWESISLSLYFIITLILGILGFKIERKLERLLIGLTELIFGFSEQQVRNFKRQKFVSNTWFKNLLMFSVKSIVITTHSNVYAKVKGIKDVAHVSIAQFFLISFASMFLNIYI